jgi:adenylate cyclase
LTRRVEEEKDRSNQFLFFTLPPFVAKSLREGHYGMSEKFEGVTILYSDIKGFTKYSASSTPENVVQLLSQLFSAFDRLTEYHGVYKVQT